MNRRTVLMLGCAVAAAAIFGIFELPFFFPSSHPSSSQSFAAGFDNRVSVLTALLASVGVFAIAFFSEKAPASGLLVERAGTSRISSRISPLALWAAIAGYILLPGSIGVAACSSPRYFMADARYFLSALNQVALDGRRPYVDFEFLYGPLLLYPPVWLHRLFGPAGLSLEASYYAMTIGMAVSGLYLLNWVINELYPVTPWNTILFAVIALVTIPLRLGANYTFSRGLAAFAAIVFLRRMEKFAFMTAAYLAGCALTTTLISLEAGVSFLAGALAYIAIRATRDRRFAWVAAGPALGIFAAIPFFGGDFLQSLRLFSGGFMNWVVMPYPLLDLYLVATIALVPVGVAAVLRGAPRDAPMLAGAYICALSLVPVALGRCDFGHVVLAGIGMFLLAFAHLANRARRFQAAAVALFCVLLIAFFTTRLFMHRHQFASLFRDGAEALAPRELTRVRRAIPQIAERLRRLTLARIHPVQELPAFLGGAKIATPWELDKDTDKLLSREGAFTPEFYTDFLDVATAEAEALKIASLAREKWALVPHEPDVWVWDRKFVRDYFLFPVTYKERNNPYPAATPTLNYLRTHYHVVTHLGDYDLYERN